MWASASDWALRRLLKVLLKRNLKGVLETELDVEQLSVSLGTGALELNDVLLSRDWLAQQAPPGLEIVSGYIGRLRLELAVTSLTCSVVLEDVLISVRPAGSPGSWKGAGAGAGASPQLDAAPAAQPSGFGIDEGVRLVAAGLETLLQRMTVTVSRLSVRAELVPAAGSGQAATLTCAQLTYGAAQGCHTAETDATAARRLAFSGLSFGVSAGVPSSAAASARTPPAAALPLLSPMGGEVEVVASWPLDDRLNDARHVSLVVTLEGVQLQLRPPDVACLLALARGFLDSHTRAAAAPVELPAPSPGQAVHAQAALLGAGRHLLLEDLMLPECEAAVQDALAESVAAGSAGQEEADEFFDASSLLGSLGQAFSSAMASSRAPADGGGAASLQGGADLDMLAMHDLAASIREDASGGGKAWSVRLAAPSLTLCLLYPESAGCASPHFAPRLVAELADLALAAGSASAGPDAESGSCSITVGLLEVAEHLPFPSQPSPASSIAGLHTCHNWLPAEEMARVPAVLPALRHLRWPAATSAGDYPLPEPASGLGLGDTLAQLSDLAQATVYQSATVAESGMLQSTMACPEGAAVPRVQVVPVLACSGQGAALVLHCSQPAGETAAPGQDVSALLQPVCLWCTLPLVARLQAFGAGVTEHLWPAAAAGEEASAGVAVEDAADGLDRQQQGQGQGQGQMQSEAVESSSKAAVSAAISDILQRQQQPGKARRPDSQSAEPRGDGGLLRLSIYCPGACLVAAVPSADSLASAAPNATGLSKPKYFAVEVQGSSSSLLASLGPRMGSQHARALVSSLHESGVLPTVALQRGGSLGGGGSGPVAECGWSCCLRSGAVAVHAAGESGGEHELGDSVLGSALATARVAGIQAGGPAHLGLGVDLHWRRMGAPPPGDLLEGLWAAARGHSGCEPGPAALWQQLSGTAPVLASARLGAPALVTLDRGTLAAAASLADGLLQLSAAPSPAEPATPAALQLECEVECSLVGPRGAPLATLTARSIHAVAGSSLGGLAGSSAVAVAVASAELTRPQGAPEGQRLLAHAVGQQHADEPRLPAVQLLAVLRPTGEPCVLNNTGRYVLPCHGRLAAGAAGATLLLDEAGRLSWAAELQAFFARSNNGPETTGLVPGDGAASPPPPSPTLDCALCLLSSSVRYEPADTRLAAAVLTVGSVGWRTQQGRPSVVEARRLSLHVGAAGSGGAGEPEQQRGTPALLADVAGFHQVAAEAEVCVRLLSSPAAGAPAAAAGGGPRRGEALNAACPAPSSPPQQPGREVVITNSGLGITLSRHTLLLLQRIARQLRCPASSGDSGSNGSSGGSQAGAWACCQEPWVAASVHPEPATGGAARAGAPGGGQGGRPSAVDVMRDVVQAAYASPQRPAEHPLEASVFLDGGWYDPQAAEEEGRYSMSPAGSPPAMVGHDFLHSGQDRAVGAAHEGQGCWYGACAGEPLLELQEDYVALQAPSEDEAAASPGSASYDCRVLPPAYPAPHRRLSLQDISITVILADTFTTVLLPEEDGICEKLELAHAPHRPGRHSSCNRAGSRAGGPQGGEDEEVVVPLSAQVQARLEGVCLQIDSFSAAGGGRKAAAEGQATEAAGGGTAAAAVSTLHSRLALLVRTLEVRDSFQPRKGGGAGSAAAAAAAATGWAGLRRMLGYHASVHRVRHPKASQVQLVVETILGEPCADLEHRLYVQLLPMLLHLDQAALAFLQHFFASDSSGSEDGSGSSLQPVEAHASPGPEPFFQRCEVQPFVLTINYRPHRVDLAALSSGQLAEVLNLVPWGGVSLQFRHLRLFGMQGISGVGTALASAYIEDIARFQAHRFVSGMAPIASICRVSSAAAQLLAIPRQQLYKHSTKNIGGLSLSTLADEDFRRQMQRGLAGFVRAVALEAINLGATVAAGAEVALAGESSASHTSGVKQALRQASAHLRSSTSGPRTAAIAAATAVRTTLLGVRNTLDKEHALERRLNS